MKQRNITQTTAAQLDRAAQNIREAHSGPAFKDYVQALADNWEHSSEFWGWVSTFAQNAEAIDLEVPREFIAATLSVGIELGYELHVQQQQGTKETPGLTQQIREALDETP